MLIDNRDQVLELLSLPEQEFDQLVLKEAGRILREQQGNKLLALPMLGYTNICRNQCLYCGMRAGNNTLKRYRLPLEDVLATLRRVKEEGCSRVFLIAGEDPKYGFENVLAMVRLAAELGLDLSLAAGEFSRQQFRELAAAGLYECVLKFEMADAAVFNRLNPSTSFQRRMESIGWIKEAGLRLASGNIIDYPGQTLEQLADDIWLMKELAISWAPVIPYLPAANTPLAAEGGPGCLQLLYKEIALCRILLPQVHITAQQPGPEPSKGLADPTGNLPALAAGADVLFVDLLPDALIKDFRVVDNRMIAGLEHIRAMAAATGRELVL